MSRHDVKALIYEIYKETLSLIIIESLWDSNYVQIRAKLYLTIDNSRPTEFLNRDNQQETKIWEQNSQKESSETVCENSFNFSEYKLHLPEHKKEIEPKAL